MLEVVKIRWLDSRGADHNWERLRDLIPGDICECVSFGVIVHQTDREVVIAPHIGLDKDQYGEPDWQVCGSMKIPVVAITEIVVLESKLEC